MSGIQYPLWGLNIPRLAFKLFSFDHGYPVRDSSYWMRSSARPLVREAGWACLSGALNACSTFVMGWRIGLSLV